MKKLLSLLMTICMVITFIPTDKKAFAEDSDTIKGNPVSIYDPVTKCTYNYVDFNGQNLIRTYMGMQSWTNDGKSFICGVLGSTTETGTIYLYNTETNEFTEVGTGRVSTLVDAVIGSDDSVYYSSSGNIKKYDIKTKETTVILPGSLGYVPDFLSLSNDCQYIAFASKTNQEKWCEDGETAIFRYHIPTQTMECLGHKFDYSNILNHHQINPTDPEIVFFVHESSIGEGVGQVPSGRYIYDRQWSANFKTGEIKNMFKQGKASDGTNLIFSAHESWSASGKYLYMNAYSNSSPNGKGTCVIRCYKDGSHREFLKNTHQLDYLRVDHSMASSDDKFTVVDCNSGRYVYLLSNDTYEQFPIYYSENGFIDTETGEAKNHPYHPHPNVARNHYIASWGMERSNGVVGIAWYDFTELTEKVAEGGRYSVNDYIDRVSYSGLDCESEDITYQGKEANHAVSDKYLYYDINEAVVDGVNESITLSFDYFDNTTNNLKLIYTDGAVTDNDLADSEDASIIITRTGTNQWKHKEITISSGNFENINPYRTDFKIGGGSDTYIANLEVKNAPDASEVYAGGDGTKENPYQIATAEQLRYFSDQVRTTSDKTEVDSNLSYVATKVSNSTVTAKYTPKRYHVFTDKYFELIADIDLSGETWTPVGNLINNFNGHFDGNGHTISNVFINGTSPSEFERYAFFGATGADVEIKNLGLENLTCQYRGSNKAYPVTINGEAYTIEVRLAGCAGFVSSYAGGIFKNCYLKDAEVRDVQEQMGSVGTGGFFGLGYGTVKATEANGYNAMTVTNCYVNGVTIRAHSDSYAFIGKNVSPSPIATIDSTGQYRVTKTITNCYTANVNRGYYKENSLGISSKEKCYDGAVYPFANTDTSTVYKNCYTTSMGEKTTVSTDGPPYSYSKTEVFDMVLETTDIDNLNKNLVDDCDYYSDVQNINGGYPILADMSVTINVTKDGVDTSKFVSGGKINKIKFYKNRATEDCYMFTVLYDRTDGNRMIDCSFDFIDESEFSPETTHTVELSTPLALTGDTSKYILKLIFISDIERLKPICDEFEYSE